MTNLYNFGIRIMFNCPNTPPFNVIENVFADLKYNLRRKNLTKSDDLIQEARIFLKKLDSKYMKTKMK